MNEEKTLRYTIMKWSSRATLGILGFLSVWMFTTILDMNNKIIQIENKQDDDKTQWGLIQQLYDQQIEHEVRLRFHQLIIEDLRNNPDNKLSEKTKELLDKLNETKKDRTVDDFRDYHREQQQQQVK